MIQVFVCYAVECMRFNAVMWLPRQMDVFSSPRVEMGKDDLAGKPEEIKEKIVMGRLKKQFEERSRGRRAGGQAGRRAGGQAGQR